MSHYRGGCIQGQANTPYRPAINVVCFPTRPLGCVLGLEGDEAKPTGRFGDPAYTHVLYTHHPPPHSSAAGGSAAHCGIAPVFHNDLR